LLATPDCRFEIEHLLAKSGTCWNVLEAVPVSDKAHRTKRIGQTITLLITHTLSPFAFLDTPEHVRLSLFDPAEVIIQLVVEA
jgi:hypothetical protein